MAMVCAFNVIHAFDVRPFVHLSTNMWFRPCWRMNRVQTNLVQQTFDHLNLFSTFDFRFSQNATNTLCFGSYNITGRTQTTDRFGQLSSANIYLHANITYAPQLSMAIIGHELLHSIGMEHSLKPGWMNLHLFMENATKLIQELPYFWGLSLDDQRGLIYCFLRHT